MTRINDDAAARRDAARIQGRFGEQQHNNPELTLVAVMTERNSEALHTALEQWGLTPDALPGIEEAWAEKFALLGSPRPNSPEEVLCDLFPDLHGASEVSFGRVVTARTPATVMYRRDHTVYEEAEVTAEQAQLLRDAHGNADARNAWDALDDHQYLMTTGKVPVWRLLADEAELEAPATAAKAKPMPEVEVHQRTLEGVDVAVAALVEGRALTTGERAMFPVVRGYDRALVATNEKGVASAYSSHATPADVSSIASAWGRAKEKYEGLEQVHADAEHLDRGPLRTFLLEGGPGKIYDIDADKFVPAPAELPRQLGTARTHFTFVSGQRDELLGRLSAIREVTAGHLDKRAQAEAALHEAALALHAAGWPGEMADLPPRR